MTWVLLYFIVGLLNALQWLLRGCASSWVEVLFFIVIWPIQLAYKIYEYAREHADREDEDRARALRPLCPGRWRVLGV